jgi:hypothetical protein
VRIFLSYRRDDAAPWAGRLADSLGARFGGGSVFQDVVTVRPGERFTDAVDTALDRAEAVLVVMGPHWLSATDRDGRRRLDDADDLVRREVAAALGRTDARLVPVLVGDATMPTPALLPSELRPLATLQAIALRDDTWHEDVARLAAALEEGSPVPADGSPPTGSRSGGRSRRSAVPVAVVALLVAVLAVVGIAIGARLLTRDTDGGATDGDAVGTSAGGLSSDAGAGTATPPPCPTPRGPGWTDVATGGSSGGQSAGGSAVWSFELLGGGYRQLPSGSWQLVLRLRATNGAVGSQFHYPFYTVLADGTSAPLTCFQVVEGDLMTSPGASSEALAGFELAAAPSGGLAVDIDDHGSRFRIDAVPSSSG